jgi:hypothetical protein
LAVDGLLVKGRNPGQVAFDDSAASGATVEDCALGFGYGGTNYVERGRGVLGEGADCECKDEKGGAGH